MGGLEVFVFVLLAVFLCVGVHNFFRCTLGMYLNRWRIKAELFLWNSVLCAVFRSLLFKIVCFPVCLHASFSCRIIEGCVSKSGPLIMLSHC